MVFINDSVASCPLEICVLVRTHRTIVLIDGIGCTLKEVSFLVGVLIDDGSVEEILFSEEFVSLVMAGGEEEMAEWSM